MLSIFNQLNVIYNEINVRLRKNLARSINTMSLNEYFQIMNSLKDIWWNLTAERFDKFMTKGQEYLNKEFDKRVLYFSFFNAGSRAA